MAVNARNLKRTGKGTPPEPAAQSNSTFKRVNGKNVPLQLNIAPEVRKEFRVYAAQHETDMSVLFVAMFQYYRENHG